MNEEVELLLYLDENWQEAGQIGRKTGCSEKTIRNRIHILQAEMNTAYAEIRTVRGRGVRLIIHDQSGYRNWLRDKYAKSADLPETSEDRQKFILHALLSNDQWIRREEFASRLLVSEKTISADLKKVDVLLAQYDLIRTTRPGYGMKVSGSEFCRRQCILNHLVTEYDEKDEKTGMFLESNLSASFKENGIVCPDYLKQSLKDYLALSVHRIREGKHVDDEESREWPRNVGIYHLSRYLFDSMVNAGIIEGYHESEPYYASFYLWGNRVLNEKNGEVQNYVVPGHTRRMTMDLQEMLVKKYGINANPSFTNGLIHHTLEVEIRCMYHIRMVCPYTEMIKNNYPAAWKAGLDAVSFVSEKLQKHVSREEPGFYAMLFQPYLPDCYTRVRGLMLWNIERAEDHFLFELLKTNFTEFMILDASDTEDDSYDLIFSTGSIQSDKYIHISYALLDQGIEKLKEEVQQRTASILKRRYGIY